MQAEFEAYVAASSCWYSRAAISEIYDLFDLIFMRINYPHKKLGKSYYAESSWLRFLQLSESGLEGVIKMKALINSLAVSLNYSHIEIESLMIRLNHIFKSDPNIVPFRALYNLLVLMIRDKYDQLKDDILCIWKYMLQRHSIFDIMKINSQHHGLLMKLSNDQETKLAFRYHYMLSRNIRDDLKFLESIEGIKTRIICIINQHFLIYSVNKMGYPIYLPRLEIHPYIEELLVALLKMTSVLRIEVGIRFNPMYFAYLFNQLSPTPRTVMTRTLVKTIIQLQYINGQQATCLESLRNFDALHAMRKEMTATEESYGQYLRNSINGPLFIARIWQRSRAVSIVQNTLEKMGVEVWSAKKFQLAHQLPVGRISPTNNQQLILFKP